MPWASCVVAADSFFFFGWSPAVGIGDSISGSARFNGTGPEVTTANQGDEGGRVGRRLTAIE